LPAHVSHNRAKKGKIVIAILSLAALYAGWRIVRAAVAALRDLPRSNDDMVFF
jgi:hypothetical protein